MTETKELSYTSSSPAVDRFAIILMMLLALCLFVTGFSVGMLIGLWIS